MGSPLISPADSDGVSVLPSRPARHSEGSLRLLQKVTSTGSASGFTSTGRKSQQYLQGVVSDTGTRVRDSFRVKKKQSNLVLKIVLMNQLIIFKQKWQTVADFQSFLRCVCIILNGLTFGILDLEVGQKRLFVGVILASGNVCDASFQIEQ